MLTSSTKAFFYTAVAAIVLAAGRPAAQAWVPPGGQGHVTIVAQSIDHVGRMRNDGVRIDAGKAINYAFDLELDYAFTDRFSISTSLPFIFSKFTDERFGPCNGTDCVPVQEVDACRCWQRAFADFGLTARYNAVNRDQMFVLTPSVAFGVPSHNYEYAGEAVVGRQLSELRVGVDAGQRLDMLVPGLSVHAGYRYSFVERTLDIPNNRSNGILQAAFTFPNGLSTSAIVSWQRTHGGLRGPEVLDPLYPERRIEFHRTLRDNYLHTGGGVSYSWDVWSLSGSVLLTARGTNSHDIRVYSVTLGRSFELR